MKFLHSEKYVEPIEPIKLHNSAFLVFFVAPKISELTTDTSCFMLQAIRNQPQKLIYKKKWGEKQM